MEKHRCSYNIYKRAAVRGSGIVHPGSQTWFTGMLDGAIVNDICDKSAVEKVYD